MNSWSCLPSDQHRDNARQCCRVHRLAWHRGQSHNKQHRLGGRWETLYSNFWGNFWILRVCLPLFLWFMALKKCRLCYFPVVLGRKILQDLLSFIFLKGAFVINQNLNTDTAALKGSRKKEYISKIQGRIVPISNAVVQKFEWRRSQYLPTFCLILF